MFKRDRLKRNVAGFVGAFLLSFTAMAEEAKLAADHPDSYVVQKSDTLWGISGKFLEKPWLWPEVWHANPTIADPDLIYPGDTLRLEYVDGKPRLVLSRGDAGKTMKMKPGKDKLDPRIRIEPLEPPIPAIPLDTIDAFLSGTRIVEGTVLDDAPYVLMGTQKHVVTGAGDVINARGKFDPKVPIYGIYRKGKIYTDEQTGEVLGIQAIDIGSAKVTTAEADVARMSVLRSTQEVRINDRFLPSEERRIEAIFYPSPPSRQVEGTILDIEGGVSEIGPMDVVLINKGKREGIEVGNVLAIYQKGERVKDPVTGEWVKLINERAGLMMVFNVFEKTSFALVLQSDRPLAVGDEIRNP